MVPFLLTVLLAAQAAPGPSVDPVARAGDLFRTAYRQAREEAQARQRAVVLVSGDAMTLRLDGRVLEEAVIRPAAFHHLKAVAHVPLGLRLLLGGWGEGPLDAGRLERLRRLVVDLQEARSALPSTLPQGPLRACQDRLLAGALALAGEVEARGVPGGRALDAWLRSQGPLIRQAVAEAARIQLEAMDGAWEAWRRELPREALADLRVVVLGAHMPREGEIAWQFFGSRLGRSREGDRVVYAEGAKLEGEALDLLATHAVDGALAAALTGDPARLHRDVLADDARAWLRSHPARGGPGPARRPRP